MPEDNFNGFFCKSFVILVFNSDYLKTFLLKLTLPPSDENESEILHLKHPKIQLGNLHNI